MLIFSKNVITSKTVFQYSIEAPDTSLLALRGLVRSVGNDILTAQLYRGLHWSRAIGVSNREQEYDFNNIL